MPKLPKDYSKGLIYKLCCKDTSITEIYVGSTTNFTQRKRSHKNCCNNPTYKQSNLKVYQFIRENGGFQNWNMVLIEYFSCETELELGRRENYWKQELQSSLNSISPPMYETYQEWYEEHKEKILERHKEWREAHQEHIKEWREEHKEQQKEWREANREKILEYHKEWSEEHKEQQKEYHKEWYEEHKEQQKIKKKEHYETNKEKILEKMKEKITCECGCDVSRGNMERHKTNAKHKSMLEKQNPLGQDNFGNFV